MNSQEATPASQGVRSDVRATPDSRFVPTTDHTGAPRYRKEYDFDLNAGFFIRTDDGDYVEEAEWEESLRCQIDEL